MVYNVGTAEVQVLPSLRGFSSSAAQQINTALSNVGTPAGQKLGQQLGDGMSSGLSATLTSLRARLKDLGDSGADSMTSLARGTAPVLDQLARVSPALGRVRDGFNSAQTAASAFSGISGTLGGQLRTVVDTTSRLGAGFVSMAEMSGGALGRVGGAIENAITAPVRTASTVLAQYGITAGTIFTGAGVAATTMGVRFAASQEQAQVAFTTMLGSAQQAQQFIAQLQTFAARTPFDLPSVTTGAQRLMAFGFAAQDVLPTLTAIGDAVSGLGGSADQINEVVIAVGQMEAKGKVQSDEILQLSEAGVPALRILANEYHVTTAAMQQMITNGVIPSSEAIPKLMAGIEQGTHGAAGATQAFAGMMSNQSTTLVGIWSNFTDNANKALGQLVTPALPAVKSALLELTNLLGAIPALLHSIGSNPVFDTVVGAIRTALAQAANGVQAFVAAWQDGSNTITASGITGFFQAIGIAARNIWDAMQPVVSALGQIAGGTIVAAWQLLGDVLGNIVAPAIVTVSTWVRPLTPVIVGLAVAFGAWFGIAAAVSAVTTAISLARDAIMAVRIAWLALSLAFTASPIGFIIALIGGLVVGIIYAWTHFQGFRDVVLACWSAIQTAAAAAWSFLQGVFAAIGSGAAAVGGFFVGLWNGGVAAFQAIGAAATWFWSTVLSPIFAAISLAVRTLIAVIITVLVTPYVIAFRALAAITTWLWTNAIGPFLTWVGNGFSALWTKWILPFLNLINAKLTEFGAWCVSIWTTYIAPFLAWVGDDFVWLWNHSIGWLINMVVTGLQLLGASFVGLWANYIALFLSWVGDGLSRLWSATVSLVFGSIQSGLSNLGGFFDWVGGRISAAWGHVGDFLQWVYDNGIHPAFDAVTGALNDVGHAFESGVDWIGRVWGQVKGIAADPVNFVIDWVYNRGIRAVWDSIAGFLGLQQLPPAPLIQFADGGVLPGYTPGRDTHLVALSGGEGVLVPEAVRGLGPGFVGWANNHFSGGRSQGGVGTPQQGHATGGIVGYADGGIVGYADGGIVNTVLGFVSGLAQNAIDLFRSPVDWIKGHIGFPDSGWINELARMPAQLIGKTVDTIWSKINPFTGGGSGVAASGDLLGWIRAAILFAGVPASWEGPLTTLITRESGGNPRAINLTDINAQRGDPSRGLMQTIGATFAAYRDPRLSPDIYDPVSNIVAGIRYIQSRYGTIFNVQQANPNLPPKGYDQGGLLPVGYSTVYNGTGTPEPVLPRDDFDALVSKARGGDGSATINVYARTDADPEHIAHTVDRHLALGMRL